MHPFAGKVNTNPVVVQEKVEKNIEAKAQEGMNKEEAKAYAARICKKLGIPFELVDEIATNESRWRCIASELGGTDYGDMQVIEKTFNYWYDKLNLEGGKTRANYLKVGLNYLNYQYKRYDSWEKARYAYARGNWKDSTEWTELEKTFMRKIDFTKYDRPKVEENLTSDSSLNLSLNQLDSIKLTKN